MCAVKHRLKYYSRDCSDNVIGGKKLHWCNREIKTNQKKS